jgi:chromate transporter
VHRISAQLLLDPWLWVIAIGEAIASFAGTSFWIVLVGGAGACALGVSGRRLPAALIVIAAIGLSVLTWTGTPEPFQTTSRGTPVTTALLFWAGLKGGLLTFGGAYTAIPFIRNDTVGRDCMTDAQFLDGLSNRSLCPERHRGYRRPDLKRN